MGSLGHLRPKGFDLFFFLKIQSTLLSSALVQLIFRPEISFNESTRRNAKAEFSSTSTAVVSSAYCSNLVSSLPMEIPFIL